MPSISLYLFPSKQHLSPLVPPTSEQRFLRQAFRQQERGEVVVCRCFPLFLVVSRCFSLFSRRFIVVSRRFSLLSRCFIVFCIVFSRFLSVFFSLFVFSFSCRFSIGFSRTPAHPRTVLFSLFIIFF